MISRRTFLAMTTGVLCAPTLAWSAEEVPTLLDHILLGCGDLDAGIAFVEEHTGIRAAFGGVHPGRGTRNALLSLGERRYLEVIAPDPKQDSAQPFAAKQLATLKGLKTPRLIGWAVHPGDVESLAKRLHEAGIATQGPWPGSRARPDGHVLSWKSLVLADDRQGSLPFFIEWSADSAHPSVDAPGGCRLERFAVAGPDTAELAKTLHGLGIDAPVERGEGPQLRARVVGPKGKFDVSS
jgi:catechol 2,3-dioxygenase-like lactoylglutathione lyase family enzyme